MSDNRIRRFRSEGFTMVEIVFAVAIISVTLIGVTAIISMGGNQATRIEDEREMAELALSVKTCVASFGIPHLRSVADGRKTEIWFWPDNAACLTGSSFTGNSAPESGPKIGLASVLGGGETALRKYSAHFETSTTGVWPNSVEAEVTVKKGGVSKNLEFRMDAK